MGVSHLPILIIRGRVAEVIVCGAAVAVTWNNLNQSQHTSTSVREGLWDSPRLDHGAVFDYRFTTAGRLQVPLRGAPLYARRDHGRGPLS